jgi:hypothetical protein
VLNQLVIYLIDVSNLDLVCIYTIELSVPRGMGTPTQRLKSHAKTELTTVAQRAITERAEESPCMPLDLDLPSARLGPGVACGLTSQSSMEANHVRR